MIIKKTHSIMLNWSLPLAFLLCYIVILSLILVYTTEANNTNKDNDIISTQHSILIVRNLSIVLFVLVCCDTMFNVFRHYTDKTESTKVKRLKLIHLIMNILGVFVGIICLVLSSLALNEIDNQHRVQQSVTGILTTIGTFFVLCFLQKIVYFELFERDKTNLKSTFRNLIKRSPKPLTSVNQQNTNNKNNQQNNQQNNQHFY